MTESGEKICNATCVRHKVGRGRRSRTSFVSQVFSLKHINFQAVENASTRITNEEKAAVTAECTKQLHWLEQNPDASKTDLENKMKKAQEVCQPVMMKLHGAVGGGGPSCARPVSPGGPRVQEL